MKKNDFFEVKLYRSTLEEEKNLSRSITVENGRLPDDYERLSKEQKTIILYILDNNKIARKEASNIINLANTKTYLILTVMTNEGLIIRKGSGRTTY